MAEELLARAHFRVPSTAVRQGSPQEHTSRLNIIRSRCVVVPVRVAVVLQRWQVISQLRVGSYGIVFFKSIDFVQPLSSLHRALILTVSMTQFGLGLFDHISQVRNIPLKFNGSFILHLHRRYVSVWHSYLGLC